MTDPFSLERRYQTLRHTLSVLTGPRNRLLHILDFIEFLQTPDSRPGIPAYAREIADLLSTAIRTVDFTGTPPHLAGRAARALDLLDRHLPGQKGQELLADTRALLGRLTARAARRNGSPPEPRGRELDGAVIPMVEREYLLPGFTPRFASLCRLVVDLRLKPGEAPDEIHVAQFTPAETANRLLEDVMRGARATLLRWKHLRIPGSAVAYCSVGGYAAVGGGSLGSGLCVALICALLREVSHREELRPRGDTAFTGIVDSDGLMRPVNEQGLRLKVEACLYAAIRYLVVPEVQRSAAVAHLTALWKSQSPGQGEPPLTIVGVTRLEEVFLDRRLIETRSVGLPTRVARSIWRYRRPLAAGLLVALVLVIARLWYGPLDKEPADLDYAGSLLLVRNRGGEVLQEIDIGRENVSRAEDGVNRTAALLDVDGNGAQEVLWIQNGDGERPAAGMVHCRTVGSGNDRWAIPVRRALRFPMNPVHGDDFALFALLAGDFDRNGMPEVLVVARHREYPSLLLRLDARTGGEQAVYVHAGHIGNITVVERPDRPSAGILMTGANNAFGEAFLVLLDATFTTGHGPVQGKYAIEGESPANEEAYALFPKTIVSEAHPYRVRWNYGAAITELPASGTIRVTVREYVQDEQPNNDAATYYVVVSPQLDPLAVQTGDDFDLLAERYFREGRIRRVPDAAYWADHLSRIRSRDGNAWKRDTGAVISTPGG